MEWLVAALVVLGFLAIVARFLARDASGQIRLPRVVDDSVGMWALRRLTGLSLGERLPEPEPSATLDPSLSIVDLARRLDGREGELTPVPTRLTLYASASELPIGLPSPSHSPSPRATDRASTVGAGPTRSIAS